MLYCPPNTTLADIWVKNGVSLCFMETVTSSILALYMVIFGGCEVRKYRTHGFRIHKSLLPQTILYTLQLTLMLIMPAIALTRFAVQVLVLYDNTVYGYVLLTLLSKVCVYPIALWLTVLERNYLLPSMPPQGHGVVLLLFWTLSFISENLSFFSLHQKDWWFDLATNYDKMEMALFVGRYVSCLLLFLLGLAAPGLIKIGSTGVPSGASQGRRQFTQGSTFNSLWVKLVTLFPFLWPKKDCSLQLRLLVCICCLICGRIINVYVPIYSKRIVDSLASPDLQFRWDLVLLYVLFKFFQGGGTGGMGLLNNLRSFLWIRIQQYTTREIEVKLFSHLHSLSLRWHLGRKTGEVLRVMDRGTDSIFNLLNYILFSITPTIIDIFIAVVYFITAFNIWFGLIVFVTMALYILATVVVTEWRTKYQRSMNLADNAQKARSVDSLLNFETVKYYGAETFEVGCFKEAILKFQEEEWKSNVTLNVLNTLQNMIVCSGLAAGSLLCVYMVVNKQGLTVGDYVLFASYIMQLYVPLNWFGTYYRLIQKNFVDMENMLELLQEDQEVMDAPGAPRLMLRGGNVEFCKVNFSYVPGRPVLNDISFVAPAGRTVAFVGPSGSGKSTIIRLLFRFYDVQSGVITIDDQNISSVTQESLRKEIGVVPQDTVLFNNTIRYNIQYGQINSDDASIVAAAQSADIHERITSFPDGYDTQVGERGLKLSGGEKQRVAIARTILKAPSVVLLDEATSALDTNTERNIQVALARVCSSKTTIIVAHRLSTIIHADEIFVLKDGQIVERGSHKHLLESGGIYYNMWQQQLENEEGNKRKLSQEENN